jgi:hypothetical protein
MWGVFGADQPPVAKAIGNGVCALRSKRPGMGAYFGGNPVVLVSRLKRYIESLSGIQ